MIPSSIPCIKTDASCGAINLSGCFWTFEGRKAEIDDIFQPQDVKEEGREGDDIEAEREGGVSNYEEGRASRGEEVVRTDPVPPETSF